VSRLQRVLFGLLAGVLAGLLGLGWMSRNSFRRVTHSVEVGLRGEALENQTLLLQKWLASDGWHVLRRGGELVARDLPEGGVLILVHLDQPISATEVDTVLAWVRRGGHLLTDGSAAPFNDDRGLMALHKALGVTVKDLNPDPLSFQAQSHQEGTDTFHDGEVPYRIRRTTRWRLVPDDPGAWDNTMGYKGSDVLVTRKEGQGRITLTPDLNFIYRGSLAELDHAAYVQRLLALQPGRGTVVVWSLPVDLSLFAWLWSHAKAVIVPLLILVGAWLWRGWPRFGPRMAESLPLRRSLLEHLTASAWLMWRGGAGAHLVARTREALERRAQRRHPAYASLDLGAKADWLAETTGGSADAIGAALDDRPGRSEAQLAQDLITLERLRQRL